MINKELLEAVLGVKITTDISIVVDDKHSAKPTLVLFYIKDDIDQRGKSMVYNLYELIHMYKEWAFKKGYTIEVELRHNSHPQATQKCAVKLGKYGCKGIAGTEPEAIFKACEWIYNEIS